MNYLEGSDEEDETGRYIYFVIIIIISGHIFYNYYTSNL
jgi:hypothetical protein